MVHNYNVTPQVLLIYLSLGAVSLNKFKQRQIYVVVGAVIDHSAPICPVMTGFTDVLESQTHKFHFMSPPVYILCPVYVYCCVYSC